jgi:hypothetical protein
MILKGESNSIMIDDILVGYTSAQLMVAQMNSTAPARIEIQALRLGQSVYIIAIAVVNGAIVLLVIFEAIRTLGWKRLNTFGYIDPQNLVVGGLRGGSYLQAALESDSDLVHVKIRQNGQSFSVRNWEKWDSLG